MIVSRFKKFFRKLTVKINCFAACALLASCDQMPSEAGATEQPKSPFADLLPKGPPAETNRVTHPAGYSIVYPHGWKTKVNHFPDWQQYVDGLSTDQRGMSGEEDFSKPSLYVQRLSETGKRAIRGGTWFKDMKAVQFQNQPAWAKFETGSLPAKPSLENVFRDATAGYPYLTQELLFERNGEWFRLVFQMHNIKGRKGPYYTEPLPSIEKYFETFKYEPPGKN